ncbi:type II secretion system protein GspN [Desulfogranum marinum]|uniref:type II secretion system protein GspN n=1 Tax=Desulfogranum marinum TaxID=453220 RepID=UPI0029C8B264|nr:type II secretion system protein GspN [Desulfogranum marinum]
MMAKTLRWGRSILGYFLFTVAGLVLMLWILFPVDFLDQWIPEYLGARFPYTRVALSNVAVGFPGKLVLTGLEFSSSAEQKTLLKVETLELQPKFASLLNMQPVVGYVATIEQGRVAGTFSTGSSLDAFNVAGQIEHVQLDLVTGIRAILGREIQGKLNAQFKGKVQSDFTALGNMDVKVSIGNGKIGLKKKILGHGVFPFSQVRFTVTGNEQKLFIDGGQVESELFSADFSGNIELNHPYAQSGLSFAGIMLPRPEFFVHVTDGQLLSAIRNQLQDDGAAFKVSGDVADPGITFGELSSLFEAAATTAEQ